MKIWVVEIGEPLPIEKGVRLLRYGRFMPWLVKQGHKATWFAATFSHAPRAQVAEPYSIHDHEGVELHTLPAPGYKSSMSFARIWHHFVYAWRLSRELKRRIASGDKPDIVINPLPTITTIDVVSRICRAHNIPYIVDIRDDWPEYQLIKLPSFLRPLANFLLWPAYVMVKHACRHAKGVSGSSLAQMQYGLRMAGRTYDENRDIIFYHGYSAQKPPAQDMTQAADFWSDQGLETNIFTLSFVGTLGFSVSLDAIFTAVERLRNEGYKIQIVICGKGSQYNDLKNRSSDGILVPGWVNAAQIASLMEQSDIGLLPYLPVPNMSMPNKIFEYMAGGLITLSSCGGEGLALFDEFGVGMTYNHEDSDTAYHAIKSIYDNKDKKQQMKTAARTLFENRFSYDALYPAMEDYLKKFV